MNMSFRPTKIQARRRKHATLPIAPDHSVLVAYEQDHIGSAGFGQIHMTSWSGFQRYAKHGQSAGDRLVQGRLTVDVRLPVAFHRIAIAAPGAIEET